MEEFSFSKELLLFIDHSWKLVVPIAVAYIFKQGIVDFITWSFLTLGNLPCSSERDKFKFELIGPVWRIKKLGWRRVSLELVIKHEDGFNNLDMSIYDFVHTKKYYED